MRNRCKANLVPVIGPHRRAQTHKRAQVTREAPESQASQGEDQGSKGAPAPPGLAAEPALGPLNKGAQRWKTSDFRQLEIGPSILKESSRPCINVFQAMIIKYNFQTKGRRHSGGVS